MNALNELTVVEMDYSALTDEDIVALNAFENVMAAESDPDDPPHSVEYTRAEALNVPAHFGFREFWAREPDGAIAGQTYVSWRKTEENRHLANCALLVRPDRRRNRLATALLPRVVDIADGEGRTLLTWGTSDRVPAGEILSRKIGGEPASAVHTNRLLIERVDREMIRAWVEDGPRRAAGYSLVAVDGPFPDDLIEQAVGVYDVMNTAPRDDLQVEDTHMTVEMMREIEKRGVAIGSERWVLFARHDASGELVGLTEVFWNPEQPHTVFQGDTGVWPEHRGHALGKWLKAAMLERILEEWPDVVDIRTGNADSNDAMLGINHALGFEPYVAHTWWQAPVDRVRDYVARSST